MLIRQQPSVSFQWQSPVPLELCDKTDGDRVFTQEGYDVVRHRHTIPLTRRQPQTDIAGLPFGSVIMEDDKDMGENPGTTITPAGSLLTIDPQLVSTSHPIGDTPSASNITLPDMLMKTEMNWNGITKVTTQHRIEVFEETYCQCWRDGLLGSCQQLAAKQHKCQDAPHKLRLTILKIFLLTFRLFIFTIVSSLSLRPALLCRLFRLPLILQAPTTPCPVSHLLAAIVAVTHGLKPSHQDTAGFSVERTS